MAQVTKPLRGRDLTNMTMTALIVADDGTLSDGATLLLATAPPDIGNVLETQGGFTYNTEYEMSEINALNTIQRNMVQISMGSTLNLNIFKVNNTNNSNPLLEIIGDPDFSGYVYMAWTEGSVGGSINAYGFYGVVERNGSGMVGRGEQIASLELGAIDPGVAQFASANS